MFDWWWKFLYNISYWINQLLDTIFKLFLYFSGSAPANVNMEITGRADGNIISAVFSNSTIHKWFLGFTLIAGSLFLVCFVIAIIRTEWAKDNKEAKLKVVISSAKGIMMLVLIPAIFGLAVMCTTTIMRELVGAMSGGAENDYSFAQQLFNCCLPDGVGEPSWQMEYSRLEVFLDKAGKSMQDYNYLVAYIGGLIMLFTIGISVLTVIGRIIELVLLYVISPIVFAVTPLDEGNRMGIWKDLVISKFLSVGGMIVCYYIFFLVMGYINKEVLTTNTFTVKIAKLLLAIGGSLTANKGGLLITNLVGHNSALIEGQQQGIMGQTAMGGAMAGLKLVGTLATSSLHLLRGSKSGTNALNNVANGSNVLSSGNASNSLSNLGTGTGGSEAVGTASMIQNAHNGQTFTERANDYRAGESNSIMPMQNDVASNPTTEPLQQNPNDTIRNGQGFGGVQMPSGQQEPSNTNITMPEATQTIEMQQPSTYQTADSSIKGVLEEGARLNKPEETGGTDKK